MALLALPSVDQEFRVPENAHVGSDATFHSGSHDPMGSPGELRPVRNRPCDTCRRRKSRCVVKEGADKCVLCEFRDQDCTFLENIPPRKRKSGNIEDETDR